MKAQVNKTALLGLQWSLGVVIFIEAALLAFSKNEIHFADRLTIDAVGEHSRLPIARHQLKTVGAEIGD